MLAVHICSNEGPLSIMFEDNKLAGVEHGIILFFSVKSTHLDPMPISLPSSSFI